MYNISPIVLDDASIENYARLLSHVFPDTKKFTTAFIKWQYLANPHGKAVGHNAFIENELAAHYVTIPILANLNGKTTKGLLSLNTATHPNHQGKKLFTQLAQKTYEQGANSGYEFVIGVANANSTPGFINKLGFQLVNKLEAKIGVGNFNQHYQEKNYEYCSVWNTESLDWRINNPALKYSVNKNKTNATVFAPTGKYNIWANMGEVNLSTVETKNDSPFGTKLWIGIDYQIKKSPLYIDLPDFLRPSPLNLIFKDLTGKGIKLNPKELRFTLLDFDAY